LKVNSLLITIKLFLKPNFIIIILVKKLNMEKENYKKVIKNKKNSLFDGHTNPFNNKDEKKKHKRSNSNVDEFAFDNVKENDLDKQLHNFMTNYDGKIFFILFIIIDFHRLN